MSDPTPFEDDGSPAAQLDESLVLDLEGYGGPIDVLLQLAREQKVDLTRISILSLADQYLEFVRRARRLHLELAADYLVMAAWLAYLKSRLLLPEPEGEDEPSGAALAAALRYRLQRLPTRRPSRSRCARSACPSRRPGGNALSCAEPGNPRSWSSWRSRDRRSGRAARPRCHRSCGRQSPCRRSTR